jgi:hypothetical protein
MSKTKSRIALHKETILSLSRDQLALAAGGTGTSVPSRIPGCQTAWRCPTGFFTRCVPCPAA